MNAHLPAHLDSMKAPPQRDAVHAAFLRASQDGKALTAESEWRRFLGELTSLKVCSSSKERASSRRPGLPARRRPPRE